MCIRDSQYCCRRQQRLRGRHATDNKVSNLYGIRLSLFVSLFCPFNTRNSVNAKKTVDPCHFALNVFHCTHICRSGMQYFVNIKLAPSSLTQKQLSDTHFLQIRRICSIHSTMASPLGKRTFEGQLSVIRFLVSQGVKPFTDTYTI